MSRFGGVDGEVPEGEGGVEVVFEGKGGRGVDIEAVMGRPVEGRGIMVVRVVFQEPDVRWICCEDVLLDDGSGRVVVIKEFDDAILVLFEDETGDEIDGLEDVYPVGTWLRLTLVGSIPVEAKVELKVGNVRLEWILPVGGAMYFDLLETCFGLPVENGPVPLIV